MEFEIHPSTGSLQHSERKGHILFWRLSKVGYGALWADH